jgi:hypothetical protein
MPVTLKAACTFILSFKFSEHLDRELRDPDKHSYASTDDDVIAGNSIHIPTSLDLSRSSAQQRTRCRCVKHPMEEQMIQIEGKKLDLISILKAA